MRRNAMAEYPLGDVERGMNDPLGAYLNYQGVKKGANVQAVAADKASDTEKSMFEQTRQDQMPWMKAGEAGLNQYAAMLGLRRGGGGWNGDPNSFTYDPATAAQASQMMQADPGFQFRLNEGRRTMENSAAARGGLLSGNTARALTDYGQNAASEEWGNILNRYASLAGVGQTQANQLGGARERLAGNLGQNAMTGAAARASGYMALPNAYAGMKQEGLQALGYLLGNRG